MIKVEWTLDTGFGPSCRYNGEIEIEEGATDDEIDTLVSDAVHDCITWYWERVGDDNDDDA